MALARFNSSLEAVVDQLQEASRAPNNYKDTLAASRAIQGKLNAARQQLDASFSPDQQAAAKASLATLAQAQTDFLSSRMKVVDNVNNFLEISKTLAREKLADFVINNHASIVNNAKDLWTVMQTIPDNKRRSELFISPGNEAFAQTAINNLATASVKNRDDFMDQIGLATGLIAHMDDRVSQFTSMQKVAHLVGQRMQEFPHDSFNPLISVMNSLPAEISGVNNQNLRSIFIESNLGLIRESNEVPTILQLLPSENHLSFLQSVRDKITNATDVENIRAQVSPAVAAEFIPTLSAAAMAARPVPTIQDVVQDNILHAELFDSQDSDEINITQVEATVAAVEHAAEVEYDVELEDLEDLVIEIEDEDVSTFEPSAPAIDHMRAEKPALSTSSTSAANEAEATKTNEGPKRR
jgi:hypothetical protein